MTTLQLAAIVLTLTASFAYINTSWLRLPSTIGILVASLVGSMVVLGLSALGVIDVTAARQWVLDLEFGDTLLHGMLGLLLFAGALHVDIEELGKQRVAIATLAVGSTVISTALVGAAMYAVLGLLGFEIRWIDTLLFGALISPTDPVAVLGILKSARAPRALEARIAGESLFNDGVGVVLFTILLSVSRGAETSFSEVSLLFAREAIGGALFGLAAGYLAFRLLRSIDDYTAEVLITLALVVGGYAAAEALELSAPIAAVVSGLVIGNQGRRLAMSGETRLYVDMLWTLIDEILNAILFLTLGLVLLILPLGWDDVGAAGAAIAVVLGARCVSVAFPSWVMRPFVDHPPHSVKIMIWGGLRGGISIAMALQLPAGRARDVIVVMTYTVVAFSLLVQGTTFRRLVIGPGAVEPRGNSGSAC